jgi:hypothetical protein
MGAQSWAWGAPASSKQQEQAEARRTHVAITLLCISSMKTAQDMSTQQIGAALL